MRPTATPPSPIPPHTHTHFPAAHSRAQLSTLSTWASPTPGGAPSPSATFQGTGLEEQHRRDPRASLPPGLSGPPGPGTRGGCSK